jgi:hypothetical protein
MITTGVGFHDDPTVLVVPAAKRKYYTPPDSYHYSGFTNLWYTFEYHCQDGTRPALDMGLTKGCLEVEQVE